MSKCKAVLDSKKIKEIRGKRKKNKKNKKRLRIKIGKILIIRNFTKENFVFRKNFIQQAGAKPPPAVFHLFRFFLLDLWIKFGKIIVKIWRGLICPPKTPYK